MGLGDVRKTVHWGFFTGRVSNFDCRPWRAKVIETIFADASLGASPKPELTPAIQTLIDAIERKDRYTSGHSKRVAHYSARIGAHLGFGDDELERLRIAAVLHDVGKVGIEDEILKKPAALDGDEWKVMRTHPELSREVLSRELASALLEVPELLEGMQFHHERWDGQGYPFGLRGDEIPFVARIIAVADAYDAMVTTRPYRKGLGADFAIDQILNQSGTQFDPQVVAAFTAVLDSL